MGESLLLCKGPTASLTTQVQASAPSCWKTFSAWIEILRPLKALFHQLGQAPLQESARNQKQASQHFSDPRSYIFHLRRQPAISLLCSWGSRHLGHVHSTDHLLSATMSSRSCDQKYDLLPRSGRRPEENDTQSRMEKRAISAIVVARVEPRLANQPGLLKLSSLALWAVDREVNARKLVKSSWSGESGWTSSRKFLVRSIRQRADVPLEESRRTRLHGVVWESLRKLTWLRGRDPKTAIRRDRSRSGHFRPLLNWGGRHGGDRGWSSDDTGN